MTDFESRVLAGAKAAYEATFDNPLWENVEADWQKLWRDVTRAILTVTDPLLAASIARWSDPSFMQLHGGEMTAQERRTVAAVVNAIVAELKRDVSWEDIRGVAPDATGGLPSEDFVREIRDAWDRTDPCPVCRGEGWELMTLGDTPPRWRECVECGNPEGKTQP